MIDPRLIFKLNPQRSRIVFMTGQIDLLLPNQLRGFLYCQRQAARRIALPPISRMDAIADMTRPCARASVR